MFIALLSHPADQWAVDCSVSVKTELTRDSLSLEYTLSGELGEILVPAPASPQQVNGLWEHTCFEAFIGISGQSCYCEFNFSPSGEWATYAFSEYRKRMDWPHGHVMRIATRSEASELCVAVSVPLNLLPESFATQPFVLGLSAVLEAKDHGKSYWALQHALDKPDFHQQSVWIPVESLSSKQ